MTSLNQWAHLANPSAIRDRAKQLSQDHRQLMADLVKSRVESGMSQADVAEVMGVSQQRVSQLERYDSDPKLSTLRRYANAVGAVTRTAVDRGNVARADFLMDVDIPVILAKAHAQHRNRITHGDQWSQAVSTEMRFEVGLAA